MPSLLQRLRRAPIKHRPRIPPQRHPDAIIRSYWRAMLPICRAARACVAEVQGEILAGLARANEARKPPKMDSGRLDEAPPSVEPRDYGALASRIHADATAAGATVVEYGRTMVGPLLRVDLPGSPWMVIAGGQHGDEPAAPSMWAAHSLEILRRAKAMGVGLRVYPCVNPEGFAAGHRRDLARCTAANAFAEYRLPSGEVVSELQPGEHPATWLRPQHQADETRALYDDLVPWAREHRPAAVLDLHQDSILAAGQAFAYVADNAHRTALSAILGSVARRFTGPLENRSWSKVAAVADPDGLLELHDGSLTDWMQLAAGVPMVAALETPIAPLPESIEIQRGFALGLLRLVVSRASREDASWDGKRGGRKPPMVPPREPRTPGGRIVQRAAQKFAELWKPKALEAVAVAIGQRTADWQKNQLDAQVRAAMGVEYRETIEAPVRDKVAGWTRENVDLIKTVPERYFDRLTRDVDQAYEDGTHPDTLGKQMAEDYDISERDADRIARTEVAKLNAEVNQARQEALGATRYVWHTVSDNRVRDNHFDLDGQIFEWSDPPMGGGTREDEPGHPGSGITCRCFAEALWDDLLGE